MTKLSVKFIEISILIFSNFILIVQKVSSYQGKFLKTKDAVVLMIPYWVSLKNSCLEV